MATTLMFAPFPNAGGVGGNIVGPGTGLPYTIDGRGVVTVNDIDVPYFRTQGYVTMGSGGGGGGGGAPNQLDTRAAAVATHIDPTVAFIQTGGYAATGDGGHALYARTTAIVHPTYGFSSADGAHWEYIPEHKGWNAQAAGVKADGVSDDSVALQNALLPFNSTTFGPSGGQGVCGGLIIPAGDMIVSQPIWYAGDSGIQIHILGQSTHGQNAPSRLIWNGTSANSWPTMFYLVGANSSVLEGVNFLGKNGVGLINCVAHTACQLSGFHLTAPVSPGVQAATPNSMTSIAVGTYLTLGIGTANFEVVLVTAITGTTFTARFRFSHPSGDVLGGTSGSSGVSFLRCTMFPGLATGSLTGGVPVGLFTVGLYCGNTFSTFTPQISEVQIGDCTFSSTGGTGGAGVFIQGGGNTCNYRVDRNAFVGFQYSVIYFGGPTLTMVGNASGNTTIAEVNATFVEIHSWECESPGAALLVGTGNYATVTNCRYNTTTLPADGYAIKFGVGNLTLINNSFAAPGDGSVVKIQAGGAPTTTTGGNISYQVTSIGNYYGNAGTAIPVFYDGSNNPLHWSNDFASARKTRLLSVGDYGDFGQMFATIGQLSSIQGGVCLQATVAGAAVNQINEIGTTTTCITVPFTSFKTGSLANQVTLFDIMPKTQIVSVVADVTTPFAGTAGTLTLTMDSAGTGDLLTAFDCKTAAIQKGLAATELGTALTAAAHLPPGGYFPSWTLETFVSATMTSSSGNLSGLTAGSVSFYITVKRFNPS